MFSRRKLAKFLSIVPFIGVAKAVEIKNHSVGGNKTMPIPEVSQWNIDWFHTRDEEGAQVMKVDGVIINKRGVIIGVVVSN